MKTRIIVDSTMDLTKEIKEKVTVVPLMVHFGDEEFIDGVTIKHNEFYEKLETSSFHPSTSQASPDAFMKVFDTVSEDEEAVVITLSHKLSGTFQSANIASEDYNNIHIVDTGSVTIGGGILVERALQLVDEGHSAKEIKEILEKEKEKIVIFALLDTLEYLKRGGRISKTAAFAGTLLNLKPVLLVVDGEITSIGKARGNKQGNALVIKEIENAGGVNLDKPVLLGYSGVSDEHLLKFKEDSKNLFGGRDVPYTSVGSVIGTHAGPGAVIVAFFKK